MSRITVLIRQVGITNYVTCSLELRQRIPITKGNIGTEGTEKVGEGRSSLDSKA